jgi:hypothetical protein
VAWAHDPLRARRLPVNLPVSRPRDLTEKFTRKRTGDQPVDESVSLDSCWGVERDFWRSSALHGDAATNGGTTLVEKIGLRDSVRVKPLSGHGGFPLPRGDAGVTVEVRSSGGPKEDLNRVTGRCIGEQTAKHSHAQW